MPIEKKIRTFILDNFLFTADESALRNAESFLSAGILDSTGMLEVILFIEEEFGITITDPEMVPENLDSVDALVALVRGKKAA